MVAVAVGAGPSVAPGKPPSSIAFCRHHLDHEHPRLCRLVLEARRGRSTRPRASRCPYGWSISLSADDAFQGRKTHDGGRGVESRLRGLSISCLQYQYSVFADGRTGSLAMGQGVDDRPIADFLCHSRPAGSPGSQHPLNCFLFFEEARFSVFGGHHEMGFDTLRRSRVSCSTQRSNHPSRCVLLHLAKTSKSETVRRGSRIG